MAPCICNKGICLSDSSVEVETIRKGMRFTFEIDYNSLCLFNHKT